MSFLCKPPCTHRQDAPPASPPVPVGKLRICINALFISHRAGRAHLVAHLIGKKYPDKYETWFYFTDRATFFKYILKKYEPVKFPPHLVGHGTSPFVHFETGAKCDIEPIGGLDMFRAWVLKTFPEDRELRLLCLEDPPYVTCAEGQSMNVCHSGYFCCCPIGDEPGTFVKNAGSGLAAGSGLEIPAMK